jgi:hypothetical protein
MCRFITHKEQHAEIYISEKADVAFQFALVSEFKTV